MHLEENVPMRVAPEVQNFPGRRLIPFRVRHRIHGQAEQIPPAVHFRGRRGGFESARVNKWEWALPPSDALSATTVVVVYGGAGRVAIPATLTQRRKDVHVNFEGRRPTVLK